jgi:hypothetical protein
MLTRAAAVLLLTACPSQHEEPIEAPVAEPEVAQAEPIAEASPPEAAPPSRLPIPSSWTSPACEAREYERQITFTDARYAAQDLVAPCPPGTQCVWSGIIDRTGSWQLERRQLRLTPDVDAPQTAHGSKFPLPPHLWLAPDGTLTEDEGACPYSLVAD